MSPSSSSSSSSSSSPPPATLDYAPVDGTYTSLYALLCAPAASSAHIALLPPAALYSSITAYLSRLPSDELPRFVKALSTSRSFWTTDALVDASTPGRIHEDVTALPLGAASPHAPSLLSRAYHLHLAAARAVFAHVELLSLNNGSTGWRTQRKLRQWVDGIHAALLEAENADEDKPQRDNSNHHPSLLPVPQLSRLAILSGLIVGLVAHRQQRKQQNRTGLSISWALKTAQVHWARVFADVLEGVAATREASAAPEAPSATADDEWEREFASRNRELQGIIAREERQQQRRTSSSSPSPSSLLLVPLHLAAQVSPHLSESTLAALPAELVLSLLPAAIFPLFEEPMLRMGTRAEDISAPTTHALFPFLGPLSRLVSASAEQAVLKMRQAELADLLLRCGNGANDAPPGLVHQFVGIARRLRVAFLSSGLAHARTPTGTDDDAAAATRTALWTALKAFLFTTVQFFDSTLDGIIEVLPSPVFQAHPHERARKLDGLDGGDAALVVSPTESAAIAQAVVDVTTSNMPPHIVEVLLLQVHCLAQLAFVTFSPMMGHDRNADSIANTPITSNEIYARFTRYRRIFYGALEILNSDAGAAALLLSSLGAGLPALDGPPTSDWLSLAQETLFLDAAEQLVAPSGLPDSLLSSLLLPRCRPYLALRHPAHLTPFESAHSCVLAIFEAKRPVCTDLMPFYVDALFDAFPRYVSPKQISHALCTVLAYLSDTDDAAAWYVVERLEDQVRVRERSASVSHREHKEQEGDDSASSSATATTAALDLKLAYADLLPYLNLVLLSSALRTVRAWILAARSQAEEHSHSQAGAALTADVDSLPNSSSAPGSSPVAGSPDSPHMQLCTRTFRALAGMDDTARQEGVRWWLEHRGEFGV